MQGNPIINQLNRIRNSQQNNQQIPNLQPYKNMMQQIRNCDNQQVALQNMLAQNPNTSMIAQLLSMKHGNLQEVAQYIANQKGYNLNAVINELQK